MGGSSRKASNARLLTTILPPNLTAPGSSPRPARSYAVCFPIPSIFAAVSTFTVSALGSVLTWSLLSGLLRLDVVHYGLYQPLVVDIVRKLDGRTDLDADALGDG